MIRANLLYGWKQQLEAKQLGVVLADNERSEVMSVSQRGYYAWRKRPAKILSE